jgi:hypothetical protein
MRRPSFVLSEMEIHAIRMCTPRDGRRPHKGVRLIMTSQRNTAAAAGTWKLGDLIVNRIGFGAMRLTGDTPFDLGEPSDRERSISVLRRAVELGVNHIDTAAFYFSSKRSANWAAITWTS